jgi:glycosyltransferase involved in cell wall biosynthesis
MNRTTDSMALAWHGLPAYAARLIRQAGGVFPVIATRPVIPIAGMDELLPGRIRWIDDHYTGGWAGLKLDVPHLYFQPAWNTPAFNQLGDQVIRNGGKVVVMFDNPWKGSLRQALGAFRFRTQWRNRFSAAWVCGRLGHRLARLWGFNETRIFQGMYGADPQVFANSQSLSLAARPQRFIFVGRLADEKGILELLQAWRRFTPVYPEWELHVYGAGKHEQEVKAANNQITYHGFQQPEIIATAMKNARFLVLPSHSEHWGLVVCEAAQSGCGLLLSANVGSAPDLIGMQNGRIFPARDVRGIEECLCWASQLSSAELRRMEHESLSLGSHFTPISWAETFAQIVHRLHQISE